MSEKKAAEMVGQLSKENERLKEEKQELLEFIKLIKDYFDNEDVSIWTEGGTKKHPMSKQANKLIQKHEGDKLDS